MRTQLVACLLNLVLVAGGCQASPAIADDDSGLIPRTVFFGNPDKAMVKISPDGKRLSYLAPHNDVMNVWVQTVGEQDDGRTSGSALLDEAHESADARRFARGLNADANRARQVDGARRDIVSFDHGGRPGFARKDGLVDRGLTLDDPTVGGDRVADEDLDGVTGGDGFIGSALVWALNERGRRDIIVSGILGKTDKWKNLVSLQFEDYVEADRLLDRIEGKAGGHRPPLQEEVSTIFHLGACSDTTETDCSYLIQNNYEYTKRLAEWALENNKRFV